MNEFVTDTMALVLRLEQRQSGTLAVSYEENNDNGEYYPKRIDYKNI